MQHTCHVKHFHMNGGISEGISTQAGLVREGRQLLERGALDLFFVGIGKWAAHIQQHRALLQLLDEQVFPLPWLRL